ncbi:MAG: YdcF family protein [Clostridiales bacterium]|nr:YdcF family protein [Clostridiales bacterium]
MGQGKRLWAAVLLLCVLAAGILPVKADTQEYRQQMLSAYSSDSDGSSGTIERCLRNLESESPTQGAMWRQIMSDWDRLNHSGFASSRSLRDDLAQDDSLCIVVFGYGLNQNGSMKPELYDRLNVALRAARQYPNAYIAVTGGETSGVKGISEAAVMAIWLMNNDVSEDRIILEKKSLSTTENAQNTCALLNQKYPRIKQLAVVTSDYHIALAATVLQTACTYSEAMQGGREMTVVAGASCATSTPVSGNLSTQAWGISILTGTKWSGVSSGSAVQKETTAETEFWEEDQPMDVETDEWFE